MRTVDTVFALSTRLQFRSHSARSDAEKWTAVREGLELSATRRGNQWTVKVSDPVTHRTVVSGHGESLSCAELDLRGKLNL